MGERLIYHIFADTGIESEALSSFGRVVRVGLDPLDPNDSEPIKAAAEKLPLRREADLAVLHPECSRWSQMTPEENREEHPNQIPLARHIGETVAEDYIIENVPRAPLRAPEGGDCEVLDGRMFGLPVPKRRAFETSFPLPEPPEYSDIEAFGCLKTHRESGAFAGSADVWKTIVGVSGEYPSRRMKRAGIPAPMIRWLIRAWLQPIPPRGRQVLYSK